MPPLHTDKLVAAGEISRLLGVEPNTVSHWARRHPELRALAQELDVGLIWYEADVIEWARQTGRLKDV
jgi:phage terminase Nu1 subunit (DNA packaging protein)